MLGDVFERFVANSPISVMVRGTLERVLELTNSICGMSAPRKSHIRVICCFRRCMT